MLTVLVGRSRHSVVRFLSLVILLTLFFNLPFFIDFIMADICTPIMFPTMYPIVFHYAALFRPVLALLFILPWARREMRRYLFPLGFLAGPIVLTIAVVLLYNGVIFGMWSLSPASQSYFLAKLMAYGPGRHYLRDVCPQDGYNICAYTDSLPSSATNCFGRD